MEYRVLGSLEVLDRSGHRLPLGGAPQQTVLASLLLRAGRVPLERLVDELWEKPPQKAANTVQVYVSRLRHELEQRAIESRPGGYALVLDGDKLDLADFEQIAAEGVRPWPQGTASGQRSYCTTRSRSGAGLRCPA